MAFTENVVLRQLRELARQCDALRPDGQATPRGRQGLQALRDTIARTQTLLQQPEVAWIVAPTLDLGQPFASLGETVRTSALLGPEAEQQLLNTAHVTWQQLKGELAGQKTALTGALLAVQRSAQLALASNVVTLHKTLDTFVQQKFVVDDGALKSPWRGQPRGRVLPGIRPSWPKPWSWPGAMIPL